MKQIQIPSLSKFEANFKMRSVKIVAYASQLPLLFLLLMGTKQALFL